MKIGVFGLGIIGSVWAAHWRAEGHEVRGWNRTARPELPFFEDDARVAARAADVVAIVVADPAAVRSVLDRIEPELGERTVVAQHATIGRSDVMEVAERVRQRGARFLDMPFTGSKPAAEARQTVFYVGDDDGTLASVEAVFRQVSRALIPIGKVGDAMALKLAMNVMIANTFQALAEGFELARRSGIEPDTFFRALELNVAKSGVSELKRPKLSTGDYAPQFSIKHMRKDLGLACALAQDAGLTLPQTELLAQAYARSVEAGRGDLDFAAMVETLR